NNSTPGRCIHIDIIDAGSCPADEPELFSRLDYLCGDFGPTPYKERVVIPDDPDQLIFRQIGLDINLELRSEQLQTIFGQRIADQYPEAHMKTHTISLP